MTVLRKFELGKIHGSLNNLDVIPITPPQNLTEFFSAWREKSKFKFTKEFQGLVLGAEISMEVEPNNYTVRSFDLGCLSIEGQICSAQIGDFLCSQETLIQNPLFNHSINEHLMVYAMVDLIANQSQKLSHLGHNIFAYRVGERSNKQSVIQKRSDLGLGSIPPWHYFQDYYTTQAFHVAGEKLFFPIVKSAL
jgi:hypothetical protein